MSTDINTRKGLVRTDMNCTECHKLFVARLNFDLDGAHVVECPHCRHEHCRVIKGGVVTDDRWDSRSQRIDVPSTEIWAHGSQPIVTSAASAFLRDRWLNRSDVSDCD